jgi:surface antigen
MLEQKTATRVRFRLWAAMLAGGFAAAAAFEARAAESLPRGGRGVASSSAWVNPDAAPPATRGARDAALLDGAEQEAMADTVQHALEFNPTRQASEWVNPDARRSGTVVPIRTFEDGRGQPCREFITAITIGGREEQGYGTACRQPDGSWQIVDDRRERPPAPPAPREVVVYPPSQVYYVYPAGFYGPSRIFLSFSSVHRGKHVHHGRRYLTGPALRGRYPYVVRERVWVGPGIHRHYARGKHGEHKAWGHR